MLRNLKCSHFIIFQVGAQFLETVVRKFDEMYKNPSEGKECDNLVALVAHLYNFQVVHSALIFDILKLLVGAFTEKDIELVLFVLRNVGFALRKDDALALKELITDAQRKASDLGSKFKDQTRVGMSFYFICHEAGILKEVKSTLQDIIVYWFLSYVSVLEAYLALNDV